jgi:hypothetical protein
MSDHPASSNDESLTTLDDRDILAIVQSDARRLDRIIRFRDWRELVAGVVVAVLILPAAIRGPWLTRLGACVILAGLLLIAYRLWHARRVGSAADPTLPVAEALRTELRRVDAQIALLGSVAWWYVAPLIGGAILMVAGRSASRAPWFLMVYAAAAVLMGWGIIALNSRAVRRVLEPKRRELIDLLAQLES